MDREGTRIGVEDREDSLLMPEVYRVVEAAMEVHRHLGCGFLEAVHQEALRREFTDRGLPFQAQVPLRIQHMDASPETHYVADFLAFDQILIKIKSIARLGSLETTQFQDSLKATSLPVGLLINFGSIGKLEWKRFVNTPSAPSQASSSPLQVPFHSRS